MNAFAILLEATAASVGIAGLALAANRLPFLGRLARRTVMTHALILLLAVPLLVVGGRVVEATWWTVASIPVERAPAPDLGELPRVIPPNAPLLPPGPEADALFTPPERKASGIPRPELSWFGWLWLAGSIFCALRLVVAWTRLRNMASRCRLLSGKMRRVLADCARSSGIPTPRLVSSREIQSPITLGVGRPVIALPERSLASWSPDQLRHIFAHECGHIAGRDCALGLLQRLVACLHWHNPFVPFLRKRLNALLEEDADDRALELEPVTARYAKTLLAVAEQSREEPALPATCAIRARSSHLETRVRRILDHRPGGRKRMTALGRSTAFLLSGLVGLGIAGCRIQGGVAESEPPPEKLRLLYIDRMPHWDYRYLKNTLFRNADLETSCFMLTPSDAGSLIHEEHSPGLPMRYRLPRFDVDLSADYDLILLGDMEFEHLCAGQEASTHETREALKKQYLDFVEQGGGLLFLRGHKLPRKMLGEACPLELDLPWPTKPVSAENSPLIWSPRGKSSSLYRLRSTPEENEQLWSQLEVVTRIPVAAHPESFVLAHAKKNGKPVMLGRTIGDGLVLSYTMNGTWKWRQNDPSLYETFWKNTVDWLGKGKG